MREHANAPVAARAPIGRLFGGAALVILHDWLGIGGSGLDVAINGVVYDAVVVCAGLACLTRALRGGPERGAWLAIGAVDPRLGRPARSGGPLYIEGNPDAPYPSPADIGYLAFYPLAASASTCWCAPAPANSTGGSGWTA